LSKLELVSIVIPTYNSEKSIETCIKSIKKQIYDNIEIIIVDNYSSDETNNIAKKYDSSIIKTKSERAKARNMGIKKAKGEFILSLDSDMELTSGVIEECVELMKNSNRSGGIIIPEISFGNTFWIKVRNFERSFYAGTKIESARFFKKELVQQVNGYEENIVFFEESTLPQKIEKIGYSTNLRIKSNIIHHEEDFNIIKWLKKKFYYAKKIGVYREKYNQYASNQISPLYRLNTFLGNNNYKKFFSRPILAFGVLILKILEYIFSFIGYIFMDRGERT
jgi:glycosyltransferase involved in cell wall biosynthesis